MIPEIGHFALILALAVALVQALLPLAGNWRRDPRLMVLARPATAAQGLCVLTAFGCLLWAFATDDFSVRYVASHSNSLLPSFYKIAALWGGA
jgi:cytochrome c-type biogenesis protein CcmF